MMSFPPVYAVWRNERLGCFEVVRWFDPERHEIVQTNIPTRAKATAARNIWRQREWERQNAE
jgi:hypothetical protein